MKISLLLQLWSATQICGRILRHHDADIEIDRVYKLPRSVPNTERNAPPLFQPQKRADRPKCSPPTSSTPLPPDIPDVFDDGFSSITKRGLERRIMTLPQTSMQAFYKREFRNPALESIVWKDPEESDICTSVFEEIGNTPTDPQPEAKSLGTTDLCGCTTLVIISRTGVYMAHYWENISFAPDKEWLADYGTPEKCFERTVIDGLTKGVSNFDEVEQVSLTSKADILTRAIPNEENPIKAYLVIPERVDDWEAESPYYASYEQKWQSIRKTVGEIIPALKDDPNEPNHVPNPLWTDYKYFPLNPDDRRLYTTPAGKVLLKYDPDHKGKKKVAMWVEGEFTDRHNDIWNQGL